jgi:hypothetical protein
MTLAFYRHAVRCSHGCVIAPGELVVELTAAKLKRCEAHARELGIEIDPEQRALEQFRFEQDLLHDAAARGRAHEVSQARTDAAIKAREHRRNLPAPPERAASSRRRRNSPRSGPLPFDPKFDPTAAGRDD